MLKSKRIGKSAVDISLDKSATAEETPANKIQEVLIPEG